MLDYTKKNIDSIELVFTLDDPIKIRRSQFEFEDAFSSLIRSGSIQPPNINNTPIFWMMDDGRRKLFGTPQGIILSLSFDNILNEGQLEETLNKYANVFDKTISKVFPNKKPNSFSINGISKWPYTRDISTVENEIVKKLINPAINVDFSNANVSLFKELKDSNIQIKYNIFAYKNVTLTFEVNKNNITPIQNSSETIQERGLLIRVEVIKTNPDMKNLISSTYPEFSKCWTLDIPKILQEPDLKIGGL